MANLPTIFTIQASDALQHTERLREILHNLENNGRINGFKIFSADENLSFITENTGKEDLILILLTRKLEAQKKHFERRFRELKLNQPETKIAEIIVDNVIYDKNFITFPTDLRPMRNHENAESAWSNIEETLKGMFPAQEQEEHVVRLKKIEKHPDYPELLDKIRPGLDFFYRRYLLPVIIVLGLTSIAIYGAVQIFGKGGVIFIFIFIFTVIGIVTTGYGIYRIMKRISGKTYKLPALIVDKRVSVSGSGKSPSRKTYYVTLDFVDKERREFIARGNLYGKITKEDVGVAYIQDRYLLNYRQLRI